MSQEQTAAVLAILSTGSVYYIIQEDKNVKRRKHAKAAERHALRQLLEINNDRLAIDKDIEKASQLTSETDKKQREYLLAKTNEMLLRLLERLDAIHPQSAILGELHRDQPATDYESSLMEGIKHKKKRLIKKIESDFARVDQLTKRVQ
ncbi:hypothetical protein DFQ30_010397 [Apophysomyces sp. BC1015]|nr:hypothetical protein DFQ30_010397 [Apophysomyces sp. BC1015]